MLPPNAQFLIEDVEDTWTFRKNEFDLIHTRIANGWAIRDWPQFLQQCMTHLKPGGYIECQDYDFMARSDDGTLDPDGAIVRWCSLMNEAAENAEEHPFTGRFTGQELEKYMIDAGFEDVTVIDLKLPIGLWPADKRLKSAGALALAAMLEGLQGLSFALFTRSLKWKPEEVEVFAAQVRNDWRQRSVHSYWPIFVVYGKKPELPRSAD